VEVGCKLNTFQSSGAFIMEQQDRIPLVACMFVYVCRNVWALDKQDVKVWIRLNWLRMGPNGGIGWTQKRLNKISEFLTIWVGINSKKYPAPWLRTHNYSSTAEEKWPSVDMIAVARMWDELYIAQRITIMHILSASLLQKISIFGQPAMF
jgi:hypothetical protein